MLHHLTIPNLLAALCVLLQCVIQHRNTCSVWNGNWCWQAQCGQHYSKTPERYLGYFPSGQDYITVYNYKYKWVSNLIHWWVNTSCSAGMLWQQNSMKGSIHKQESASNMLDMYTICVIKEFFFFWWQLGWFGWQFFITVDNYCRRTFEADLNNKV